MVLGHGRSTSCDEKFLTNPNDSRSGFALPALPLATSERFLSSLVFNAKSRSLEAHRVANNGRFAVIALDREMIEHGNYFAIGTVSFRQINELFLTHRIFCSLNSSNYFL